MLAKIGKANVLRGNLYVNPIAPDFTILNL